MSRSVSEHRAGFWHVFWASRKNQASLRTGRSFDLGKMSLPALWMAYLTYPTILLYFALIVMPLGWLLGGLSTALLALAVGLAVTCFYEFSHCIQHLAYKPRWRWVAHIKQLHLLHHFHHEGGNYGITNYIADRLFGSHHADARPRARSPHVFNLGYDLKQAEKYPWVMERTGVPPKQRPEGAMRHGIKT